MAWVATAVIGSAVIGGISSSRAAKKGAQAAERGQDILAQSREQGRADVNRLFPEAQASQTKGFEEFRGFLNDQVLPQQTQPFIGGNMAAQEQVARGLPQIQNAILGNPTDLSGFYARQIGQAPSFNLEPYTTKVPEAAPEAKPFQFDLDAFKKQYPTIGQHIGASGFDPFSKTNRGNFKTADSK